MGTTISQLSVDLVANSAKFTSEMEKSRKSVDSMKSSLSLIKLDSIINLGERAYRTAQQIYGLMESTSSLGSEIQRMSRTFGMSTNEYQQWLYVAKAADVEQEQFMMGLRVLTKNMGDFGRGTGEAKDAFERLGMTSRDASKTMGELLPDLINRLSKIGNVSEQNALSMEVFGSRSGLALANMAREGKNIDEIIKRFKELGGGIDDVSLNKLANSEQAFKDFGMVLQKTKAEMLAPAVVVFAEMLKAILDIKSALLENDWKALWGRMSPAGAGEAQKGGIGSMYLEYERSLKDKAASLYGGIGTGVIPKKEPSKVPLSKEEKKELEKQGGGVPSWLDIIEKSDFDERLKEVQFDVNAINLEFSKTAAAAELVSEVGTMPDWRASLEDIPAGIIKIDNELYELKDILDAMNIDSAQWTKDWVKNWKTSGEQINDIVKEFSSGLSSAWTTNMTGMIKGAQSFSDAVKNIFSSMGDAIISEITKMATQWLLFGSITGKKESGGGFLGGGSWSGLLGGITGLLGSKQSGSDYIPQTGPYLLHKGEAVIPAEKNKESQGGTTVVYIEATDVNSFERKYGSVIDSRVIHGKRFKRVGMRD